VRRTAAPRASCSSRLAAGSAIRALPDLCLGIVSARLGHRSLDVSFHGISNSLKAPRLPGAYFVLSCIGGYRTGRQARRWSVGHAALEDRVVTSPDPSIRQRRIGAPLARSAFSLLLVLPKWRGEAKRAPQIRMGEAPMLQKLNKEISDRHECALECRRPRTNPAIRRLSKTSWTWNVSHSYANLSSVC
jgi:hypothetical protein